MTDETQFSLEDFIKLTKVLQEAAMTPEEIREFMRSTTEETVEDEK